MMSTELTAVIDLISAPESAKTPTLEESRAGYEQMMAEFPIPSDISLQPVDAGGVPSEWVVAPNADPDRVILYFHGGGYVIGSINTHREMCARLSRAAKARVLVIDYRLAPEHPFPAPVEDAVASYKWLLSNGVEPANMALGGDSAGGGLTVATLVALRDEGQPLPAAGVCLSPWVDLEGIGDSMTTKADVDPMVQKDGLGEMANLYLNGADPRSPLAAPLYADLTGLPPLLVQVGTAETLLDDSTRLAAKAEAAGVEVVLEPWEDMIHVWQSFAAMLPEGQQAIDRVGEYILDKTA